MLSTPTTSTAVGSYSRGGNIAITYSGNTPIGRFRIYQTTTNYSNGGYGGAGQGYNQALGAGTAGGTNAGQGGTGGSCRQAGAIGFAGNYGNGTAGCW